jgi:hypothetical protein
VQRIDHYEINNNSRSTGRKASMDKARIEARIIELARAFAGLTEYHPSSSQKDRDYACKLRGRFQALIAHLDEITKGEKA